MEADIHNVHVFVVIQTAEERKSKAAGEHPATADQCGNSRGWDIVAATLYLPGK